MSYSVYARDRKTGRRYALPERYFGHLPTRSDAEVALAWYLETSAASALQSVDLSIQEHYEALEATRAGKRDRDLVTL